MRFLEKLEYLTGEETASCYQCGICSGTCPVRFSMDSSPMQIIGMVNRGLEERIFSSNTIWICSTCFSCQVKCPRGINIPKIFEALRQMRLRKGEDRIKLDEIPLDELQALPQIALISNQRKFSS